MGKGMSKVEFENGEYLLISDFENVLSTTPIISYSDSIIEIPGIVMFIKDGTKPFWTKILNPGTELIPIDHETFDYMLEAIEAHRANPSIICFKNKTMPVRETIVSLRLLAKHAIFVRVFGNSMIINDTVFTSNEAEFHGDGMFTSRKVYLVNFDQMAQIKKAILEEE